MRQLKIISSITDRKDESLNKYLIEVSRMPMISSEEEVELAQQIRKGGKQGKHAKDRLISANLRFVVSVAKQYQHQGLPLCDLINEGNIGLMVAADRFDETRGFKFISYAIWWIRQSLLQAIADKSHMVRRPQSQIGISNKIKTATNKFYQDHQRQPSAEELSDIISLEIEKIETAIKTDQHVSSIDKPVGEDEGMTIADSIASSSEFSADCQVDSESVRSDLMMVLNAVLNEREKTILLQSFGIGCPERGLEDIGSDMGLTRERVRQIRERGLDKVRKNKKSRLLLTHLG